MAHGSEFLFMMPLFVLGHFFGVPWVKQRLYGNGFLKPPSRYVDPQKQQHVGLRGYQLAGNFIQSVKRARHS